MREPSRSIRASTASRSALSTASWTSPRCLLRVDAQGLQELPVYPQLPVHHPPVDAPAVQQGVELRLGKAGPLRPYQGHRLGAGVGVVVGRRVSRSRSASSRGASRGWTPEESRASISRSAPARSPISLRRAMSAGRASFRWRKASFWLCINIPLCVSCPQHSTNRRAKQPCRDSAAVPARLIGEVIRR